MTCRTQWERHWTFKTAHFEVAFETTPEEDDPADSFQFQEDIDSVLNGEVDWFAARVVVLLNETELAADYLGGCAYTSVHEFYTSHRDPDPLNRNSSIMRAAHGYNVSICHYFPSMVSEAIAAARAEVAKLRAVNLRA